MASVMPKHVRDRLAEGAIEIAKGRKAEEAESNPVVAAIPILIKHFPKNEDVWNLRTEKACELLGEIPGVDDKTNVQGLLRKLGFRSENSRIQKKVLRAYRMPTCEFERLAKRYS